MFVHSIVSASARPLVGPSVHSACPFTQSFIRPLATASVRSPVPSCSRPSTRPRTHMCVIRSPAVSPAFVHPNANQAARTSARQLVRALECYIRSPTRLLARCHYTRSSARSIVRPSIRPRDNPDRVPVVCATYIHECTRRPAHQLARMLGRSLACPHASASAYAHAPRPSICKSTRRKYWKSYNNDIKHKIW